MSSSLQNELTIVTSQLRRAKAKLSNLMELADRALWNSLEYGKQAEIFDNAQKFETMRQRDEILDDAIRYSSDITNNFKLIFQGGASENLLTTYSKFCAYARFAEDPVINHFITQNPPPQYIERNFNWLTADTFPTWIRQYMRINRVPPEIVLKVEDKFPMETKKTEPMGFPQYSNQESVVQSPAYTYPDL